MDINQNYTDKDSAELEKQNADLPKVNEQGVYAKPGLLNRFGDWLGDLYDPNRVGGHQFENQKVAALQQEIVDKGEASANLESRYKNLSDLAAARQNVERVKTEQAGVNEAAWSLANQFNEDPTRPSAVARYTDPKFLNGTFKTGVDDTGKESITSNSALVQGYQASIKAQDPAAAAQYLQTLQESATAHNYDTPIKALQDSLKTTEDPQQVAEIQKQIADLTTQKQTAVKQNEQPATEAPAQILADILTQSKANVVTMDKSGKDALEAKQEMEKQTADLQYQIALARVNPAAAATLSHTLGAMNETYNRFDAAATTHINAAKVEQKEADSLLQSVSFAAQSQNLNKEAQKQMLANGIISIEEKALAHALLQNPQLNSLPIAQVKEFIRGQLTKQGLPTVSDLEDPASYSKVVDFANKLSSAASQQVTSAQLIKDNQAALAEKHKNNIEKIKVEAEARQLTASEAKIKNDNRIATRQDKRDQEQHVQNVITNVNTLKNTMTKQMQQISSIQGRMSFMGPKDPLYASLNNNLTQIQADYNSNKVSLRDLEDLQRQSQNAGMKPPKSSTTKIDLSKPITVEQARTLPSGTDFIGIDGKKYRTH